MGQRSYDTGRLYSRADSGGRESWYGRWRVGEHRFNRRLGLKRPPRPRDGLTRAQAERELQRRVDADQRAPLERSVNVGGVRRHLLAHLAGLGRKRSTLDTYESYLRVHLVPFFGERPIADVGVREVERFVRTKTADGQNAKSILNYLGFLHSIFFFVRKRGIATENPVALIDKPRRHDAGFDVRYLGDPELDALLDAVLADPRGATEQIV